MTKEIKAVHKATLAQETYRLPSSTHDQTTIFTMARCSFFAIAILLASAACMVSADGPNFDASSGVDIEGSCEAAATCYYSTACRNYDEDKEGKDDRGTPFRACFFDCLEGRISDDDDGEEFVDYVEEVYEYCQDKRGEDAPEGKVLKCTLHKIKKDACDEYFPGDGYKALYD